MSPAGTEKPRARAWQKQTDNGSAINCRLPSRAIVAVARRSENGDRHRKGAASRERPGWSPCGALYTRESMKDQCYHADCDSEHRPRDLVERRLAGTTIPLQYCEDHDPLDDPKVAHRFEKIEPGEAPAPG